MKYPQEFIDRCKKAYPNWEKLHEMLESGNDFAGRYLDDSCDTGIKISKIESLMPFIQSGVFGLGLPQIVELFLRSNFSDLLKKIHIVFLRLFLFLKIILQANAYEMRIGRNSEGSAEKLINFMNKN